VEELQQAAKVNAVGIGAELTRLGSVRRSLGQSEEVLDEDATHLFQAES
jgi:hypothetical protein